MTPGADRRIMAAMSEPSTRRAADLAVRLVSQWPGARAFELPMGLAGRDIGNGESALAVVWEPRKSPREHAIDRLRIARRMVAIAAAQIGARAAIEGICRVTEGGTRLGRKSTCIVVHVSADDEPARVVLLPVE